MDLNLPIIKSTEEDADSTDTKGVNKKLSACWRNLFSSSSSGKQRNTDLQFCLDRYFHPELLDGDNQYYCNDCGRKTDAHRQPVLQKPPQVLNVQLSRYVYDREKGMKKKLSDKVLLPQDLSVEALATDEDCDGPQQHRYLLCAVMRHQGTSAYSGHYIAEAMDWLTGIWYEFNDEKVTVIDKPSCSYDETILSEIEAQQHEDGDHDDSRSDSDGEKSSGRKIKSKSKNKKLQQLSGSTDAYNMYYVEESFLATSVLEVLRCNRAAEAAETQQQLPLGVVAASKHLPEVIQTIIQKRIAEYKSVAS